VATRAKPLDVTGYVTASLRHGGVNSAVYTFVLRKKKRKLSTSEIPNAKGVLDIKGQP